jgi:hypothetical protein
MSWLSDWTYLYIYGTRLLEASITCLSSIQTLVILSHQSSGAELKVDISYLLERISVARKYGTAIATVR